MAESDRPPEGKVKTKGVYAAFAVFVSLGMLVAACRAQEDAAPRMGIPQDWTLHHVAFTRDGLTAHPDAADREPRVRFQMAQRSQYGEAAADSPLVDTATSPTSSSSPQDWNVSLGAGRVAANMYPAKYGFDASTASCTADYVVYGLAAIGNTGGQANLIAFNNLYSGTSPAGFCGTAPSVMFAYNTTTVTGGRISTSPVMSQDGTKIAFVESSPTLGEAIFHVVTWAANPSQGTITAAAAPPSMTSLVYSPTANSTTSSPWIDYATDSAYVGADNGKVYKIQPVFTGTPALVTTAPWPVTVTNNLRLTAPVLDSVNGFIMVGAANGNLYQIDIATGGLKSLAVGKTGQRNPGILGPPIVDVTNGVTYVVSSNDGTSGVLVEADTVKLTQLAKGRLGIASANGTTTVQLFQPALNNDYYNSTFGTAAIHSCGTGAATIEPWQYSFGFTVVNNQPVMNNSSSFSARLLTSTTARCTGWTEFFNPNISGGTDFFFFGLTNNCVGASGCVASTTGNTAATTAAVAGGPSGIVVDNFSTVSQASSIYFTARGTNRAYKFTQSGLLP